MQTEEDKEIEIDSREFISKSIFGSILLFFGVGSGFNSVFLWSFIISSLIQFGIVLFSVIFIENTPEQYSIQNIPDRFVQIIAEQEEENEEAEIIQEQEEPEEQIVDFVPAQPEEIAEEATQELEEEIVEESQGEAQEVAEQEINDNSVGDSFGGGGIGGSDSGSGPVISGGGGNNRGRSANSTPRQPTEERRAGRREENARTEENQDRVSRLEDTAKPPCEQMRRIPEVPYPEELRVNAIHGVVQIQCIVIESGHLRGCRHRGGPEELFRVALPAVEQWRCTPAENSEGERIAAPFNFRIPFRLEG